MFITFEGIEGSGKSTLLALLADSLKRKNFSVFQTREPGGSRLGKKIRTILLDETDMIPDPWAEIFLFLSDRAQHVEEIIKPALKEHDFVLCDRYTDSTIAYQAYGRGLEYDKTLKLCQMATDLEPDLTFLLDIPVREGLARASLRNCQLQSSNRFDDEKHDFHEKVRNGFLRLAREHSQRIRILDAKKSPVRLLDICMSELGLQP